MALLLAVALGIGACGGASGSNARKRAALLVDKHQPAEAARVLREAIARDPSAVAERRLLIRVLGLTGDLAAAEREAQALAERVGAASASPWIELGHAYELSHRYEEALALYDRAAEAAPADPEGPREGGLRAAHWGEAELAEPRLIEALRRNSRDARVWHALGLVRARLRDLPGAARAYESGLEADPGALENRLGLASLAIARNDPAEALVQYDAIIAARPRLADAYLGRSWALMKLGRYAEAEQALGRASALGGDQGALRAQRELLAHLRSAKESN